MYTLKKKKMQKKQDFSLVCILMCFDVLIVAENYPIKTNTGQCHVESHSYRFSW